MKVLHLSGKDFYGAGRAAYRLHMGLRDEGIESIMWVGAKRTDEKSVRDIHVSYLAKKLTKFFVNFEKFCVKKSGAKPVEMFSLGEHGHSLKSKIKNENPDIVHLHWINRGFMNIKELIEIEKPIVISLHDMWWFTGGCHYDQECGRYKLACGECPVLNSKRQDDLSFKHHELKKTLYNNMHSLTLVPLSSWMSDCVHYSSLGKNRHIHHIPNGIDTILYKPKGKGEARKTLRLPLDKKIVLYAAVDALSESRKGYPLLKEALGNLCEDYELVVIGEKNETKQVVGLKSYFIGEVRDDNLLVSYLSAVDVVVVPSLQENLSNLIMEAMCCATPVVAFAIGGNGDMINHLENGYLAKKFEAEDFANGIIYCADELNNSDMGEQARKTIESEFDIRKISGRYLQLYHKLLASY